MMPQVTLLPYGSLIIKFIAPLVDEEETVASYECLTCAMELLCMLGSIHCGGWPEVSWHTA
jgi:hypothetical protein